jgi:hypothetical protein
VSELAHADEGHTAKSSARIALIAAAVAGIACLVVGFAEAVSPTGSTRLAVLMFVLAASGGWRVTIYLRLLRRSQ